MMRILVGFNGSEAAMTALEDLRNAGLPAATQVLIFSVAELWVAPRTIEEAKETAARGKAYLNAQFPEWTVYTETASGSPAREILARAETFKPDLIVMGKPSQSAEDRNIFLGLTTRKVLTEADCPVRIARGHAEHQPRRQRILTGFDGSEGAMNAVKAIASKNWTSAPEVKLLAVTDIGVLTAIDHAPAAAVTNTVDLSSASNWLETVAAKALNVLKGAGIDASVETRLGRAKDAIIEEADKWEADSIYVGPHGSKNSFDRYLLGSVSAAVAARAHCSVEVVRPAHY